MAVLKHTPAPKRPQRANTPRVEQMRTFTRPYRNLGRFVTYIIHDF